VAAAQQQTPPPSDQAVLATLTTLILSGLTAQELATYAGALLASLGISAVAVQQAISLLHPHLVIDGAEGILAAASSDQTRAAERWVLRTAAPRHGAYLLRAAGRLAGEGTVERERRFVSQHLAAERARRDAAKLVDGAAMKHGPMLTWVSVLDPATTYGCRAAHGGLFRYDRPPIIEGSPAYPGTPHGGSCRCSAGPPSLGHFALEVAG
jgi:hypothetical protein